MSLKTAYHRVYNTLDSLSINLERNKTYLAEVVSVNRRREFYRNVVWSETEEQQFKDFWSKHYGKNISSKWHKIYQYISGCYSVDYIPEILFSTRIEYALNDYRYARVLEDKYLVEAFARVTGCIVPETIVVKSRGQWFNNSREPISKEQALQIVTNVNDTLVCKPTVSTSSGQGILFVEKGQHIDIRVCFQKHKSERKLKKNAVSR